MSKIKKILGITALEDKLKRFMSTTNTYTEKQDSVNERLLNRTILLENRVKELESLIRVGVDVHMYGGRSWAIVCVSGHPEFVQFVDLDQRDAREITQFISKYDRKNVCVDLPPALFFSPLDSRETGRRKR